MVRLRALLLGLLLGFVACTSAADPLSEPTSAANVSEATAVSAESTIDESTAGDIASGRTSEGLFFLGAEDAAVTLIDYSDFL